MMVEVIQHPIVVKCPNCKRRILDKTSDAQGIIELKCPQCFRIVKVNLTTTKTGTLKYRIVAD